MSVGKKAKCLIIKMIKFCNYDVDCTVPVGGIGDMGLHLSLPVMLFHKSWAESVSHEPPKSNIYNNHRTNIVKICT